MKQTVGNPNWKPMKALKSLQYDTQNRAKAKPTNTSRATAGSMPKSPSTQIDNSSRKNNSTPGD